MNRFNAREVFAENLRGLMNLMSWSQKDLEAKSKVPQKSISHYLNMTRTASIEQAEKIAAAFGLHGWQILMPGIPKNILIIKRMNKLIETYETLPEDSRHYIDRVAEREAIYVIKRDNNAA